MAALITGIYRLYDPATGDSFLGFSHNVAGTVKRLRFELALNACSYRPLQEFYNERGELEYEVMEEYDRNGLTPEELEAHLIAKLMGWREKLGLDTRLIQCEVIA